MATKKFEELNAMDNEQLQTELVETEQYLQKMRFDHSVKGLANPILLRNLKKDIARIKTELRRREIEAMSAEELAGRTNIRARRKRK